MSFRRISWPDQIYYFSRTGSAAVHPQLCSQLLVKYLFTSLLFFPVWTLVLATFKQMCSYLLFNFPLQTLRNLFTIHKQPPRALNQGRSIYTLSFSLSLRTDCKERESEKNPSPICSRWLAVLSTSKLTDQWNRSGPGWFRRFFRAGQCFRLPSLLVTRHHNLVHLHES